MAIRPRHWKAWLLAACAAGCGAQTPEPPAPVATQAPAQAPVAAPEPPAPEPAPTPAAEPPTGAAPPQPKPVPVPLPPPQTPDPTPKPAAPPAPYLDISITTLSKGRGVPEPTREAYQRVRALMDHKQRAQQLSGLNVRRMGLEGETRLCARFSDAAQAREALAEIRELTAGVELIAVESTPCIPSKEDAP